MSFVMSVSSSMTYSPSHQSGSPEGTHNIHSQAHAATQNWVWSTATFHGPFQPLLSNTPKHTSTTSRKTLQQDRMNPSFAGLFSVFSVCFYVVKGKKSDIYCWFQQDVIWSYSQQVLRRRELYTVFYLHKNCCGTRRVSTKL